MAVYRINLKDDRAIESLASVFDELPEMSRAAREVRRIRERHGSTGELTDPEAVAAVGALDRITHPEARGEIERVRESLIPARDWDELRRERAHAAMSRVRERLRRVPS